MDETRISPSLHVCHCGGSCMFRLHVRDGKLRQITSEGDIPAEGSHALDESLFPEQRRACLKGFCELERNSSRERILAPLAQRGKRGDAAGFAPISWESALDEVAAYYGAMIKEQRRLGYLPIYDKGGVTPWLGSYIGRYGTASLGNLVGAMQGALGPWGEVPMPHIAELAATRLLVIWSSDPTTSRPHWAFRLMKAKEAGIPVVVVDSRLSDAAAALATGYRDPDGKGADVPPFICVRPGSDAALLAAMAFVVVERNLHDEAFLREQCFGFYPGDSVRSASPARDPVTGEAYAGRTYDLPTGESFLEYLTGLGVRRGGLVGVLRWAAGLTGVPEAVIEALAIAYATARPAFLLSSYHGGAQRQENGMYFSWLLIALSALTGNIGQPGGGFGDIRQGGEAPLALADPPALDTTARAHPAIKTCISQMNRVILEGTDGRTPRQLREDVLAATGLDLGPNARLEVKMFLRGASSGDAFNQFPGINRRLAAWEKLDHVVSYERYLSATARHSDIVLPSCTPLEERYLTTAATGDACAVGGIAAPPPEARPDWWIQEQLATRLGIPFTPRSTDTMTVMERQWEAAVEKGGKPAGDLAGLLREGSIQAPPSPYEPPPPGRYPTETGRINFYSPFLAERGRTTHGVSAPRYVVPSQGLDDVMAKGGLTGRKGLLYPLQLLTPHVRQRAHSSFDNVATLRELYPHAVLLHPADAKERDIADGDKVYVYNDAGCIKLPARLSSGILPGVVAVGQGTWYRPSPDERYTAWYDDGTGLAPHPTPVDIGGNPNTITPDIACGVLDPFFDGAGIAANGILCQTSKTNPDEEE